jgi:hypothetical protein
MALSVSPNVSRCIDTCSVNTVLGKSRTLRVAMPLNSSVYIVPSRCTQRTIYAPLPQTESLAWHVLPYPVWPRHESEMSATVNTSSQFRNCHIYWGFHSFTSYCFSLFSVLIILVCSYTKLIPITCRKKTEITVVRIRRADHATPLYPQKLTLTSPTSGGRSVGIRPRSLVF